jgi:hypothetical protein
MPPGFAEIDQLLVERAITTTTQAREIRGSLAVSFRKYFGEQFLPELCAHLERARLLAASNRVREAGAAYESLLVASQILQLAVAVMAMADHADAAGQPSWQLDRVLETFVRQMEPITSAAASQDSRQIEKALTENAAVYQAWVAYLDRWAAEVQSGASQVRTAKMIWDSVMLAVAFAQAGNALGRAAGAASPPAPPLAAIAGGRAGTALMASSAAHAQLVEALRKLIASGAIDAAVVAGISRTLDRPANPDALPAPGLPTSLEMAGGPRPPTVEKVNGRYPINSQFAGKVYPAGKLSPNLQQKYPSGVRFDDRGFPDFRPYAIKEVKLDGLKGNQTSDFVRADKAAGFAKRPPGYTWHHHQDCRTMQLVPEDLHFEVRHTGGTAILTGGGP